MSVGNWQGVQRALDSKDPQELWEAWIFYNRVENRKLEKDSGFDPKVLAPKRIQILNACLEICLNGDKLVFFGTRAEIKKQIKDYQKEIEEFNNERR